MSFTIDDTMTRLVYDLTDRQIYNDIRSQTQVSNTTTVVDSPTTYGTFETDKQIIGYIGGGLGARITVQTQSGQIATKWLQAHVDTSGAQYDMSPIGGWIQLLCTANDGVWSPGDDPNNPTLGHCTTTPPASRYTLGLENMASTSCTLTISDNGDRGYGGFGPLSVWATYQAIASEEQTHDETTYTNVYIRATDDASIQKYGRRVLPLTWSEGTDQNGMQAIVDAALRTYKEPAALLNIEVTRENEDMVNFIFTAEISDLVTVHNTKLGLTGLFYVDKISISDTPCITPVGQLTLIEQRDVEAEVKFMIDEDYIDENAYIQ